MNNQIIWSWDYAFSIFPFLFKAMWVTLSATVIGFAISAFLGLILALGKRSKIKLLSWAITGFIEFVRGTPLLIQLFFIFYALPQIPYVGITLSPFMAGVIGLGLHYSTYLSEIYRSGIDSIVKGQWEASTALNFSRAQTWLKIILPQAIPPIIPMLGNYLIVMFKETPLLMSITVVEMLQVAQTIGSQSWRYIEPITLVGFLFLVLSYPAALFVRWLEGKMNNRLSKKRKTTGKELIQ